MACGTHIIDLFLNTNNFISYPRNCWRQPVLENNNFMPMQPEGIGILPRNEFFSPFCPSQSREAHRIIDMLFICKNLTDFMMAALYFHPRVNQMMFAYALSVVVVHRHDCRGIEVPNPYNIFPDHFFEQKVLQQTTQNNFRRNNLVVLTRQTTGTNKDLEHRIAYFREDVALNSHHWHWHVIYPNRWSPGLGKGIKDRKGELFYYMHSQMLRRYNAERLSNGIIPVLPYLDWDEPIPEGYYSHLYSNTAMMEYGARPSNLILADMDNPILGNATVDSIKLYRERILQAIRQGYVLKSDGSKIPIVEDPMGIDMIGAIVESSDQSPNRDFYGNMHNTGHELLSVIHDPDNRYNSPLGVMGFVETAMRDPIFYRWHKFLDLLFEEHKHRLRPYPENILTWPEVQIEDVNIVPNHGKLWNTIRTFFTNTTIKVSRGLDFQMNDSSIMVKYEHIQHDSFKYRFRVINRSNRDIQATVRIFIAPKYNIQGKEVTDEELRLTLFEMDKFIITLCPGENKFARSSAESSVTMSPERTWREISRNPMRFNANNDGTNACGCGWPDHMLLPRGTKKGMEYIMFVMLTNWYEDKVDNPGGRSNCKDAVSFCGILGEYFPDRKPMGFPIDRKFMVDFDNPCSRLFFQRPNMFLRDKIIIRYNGS